MTDATVNIVKEECFLDEILHELPNRVAKPTPTVKGNNLSVSKLFHQISDSLKDLHLIYTCLDVSSVTIALGSNVGNAFIYQRVNKKILKISSDTKYVPTTCIRLVTGCGTVAFGHETGTFSVGLIDPPIHRRFDSLTAQDIHHSAITCLEWSTDGLILYTGDSNGKISMSVVKISEGILQTAIIVNEDASIVQLSFGADALLASTTKRTILWSFRTETITQVGEKERKTSGSFGCCFIPEDFQEPSKKLYAARHGQRIWTADESGKVSSTSVFKSLLADKPQTIYTLTGNDGKMNSGGQFSLLLIYYNKFVITWDQNHLWILDLQDGVVVGCHSNLGKIRDVAVSGHEVFVLLNQRERFLRRFALVTESLGPSCLDAVIAIRDHEVAETSHQAGQFEERKSGNDIVLPAAAFEERKSGNDIVLPAAAFEERKSGNDIVLPAAAFEERKSGNEIVLPAAVLKTEGKTNFDENDGPDVFQKINAIPVDSGKGDIVFTGGVKRKKKKKKVKQASVPDGTTTVTEPSDTSESPTTDTVPSAGLKDETSLERPASQNETPAPENGSNVPTLASITLNDTKKETKVESQDCTISEIQESSPVVSGSGGNVPDTVVPNELTISNQEKAGDLKSSDEAAKPQVLDDDSYTELTDEVIETLQELNESPKPQVLSNENLEELACTREVNDNALAEHAQQVATDNVSTPTAFLDTPDLAFSPVNDSGVSTGSESKLLTSPQQESMESGDEYRILDVSSNYLRSDSYEPDDPGSPDEVRESKEGGNKSKTTDEDYHVPLFADTWSSRVAPTVQAISSLALSEKYVFCADTRGQVYYSDPSTASCHGWEQVDWKANQICLDSPCGVISFVAQGNKAFIRANVSAMHPVGNKSFLIIQDVSSLATCSVCSWVITVSGGLKRADSSTLLALKGDVKNAKIWYPEDSIENLCQIACYNTVLWGRTLAETLFVYAGRPGGKKATWKKIEEKKAKWVNMSDDGTVWIITPDDQIWFNPGVSTSSPTGEVWYQVTLGQYIIDDDASILGSTVSFFQSVGSAYRNARTTEYLRHAAKGLIQSTKDMACSLFRDGGHPKQIYCNMKSGVWLLDTKNTLHACRGQVTGAYWKRVCPSGTAQSATWRHVSTGLGSYVWALQPNGELTCFNPSGPSYNVEGPSSHESLDYISSSPHGVWCFSTKHGSKVYVRDGISESYPQGFAWTSLTLRDQEIKSVKHLSVGRITVWAVDNNGNVWIRIGTVGVDQSTVLSQAWLPLDNPTNTELGTIEVNAKDSMVWATDIKGNVFARDGVKEDFLVGSGWREVSGALLKSVCLSSCVVYGLCTNGEVVCRFGVSPTNCVGDYWKKIPGHFVQMSVNGGGELWGISQEEWLFVRKTKCLFGKVASKEEKQEVTKEKVKQFVDEVDAAVDDVGGDDDDDDDEDGGDWELL